MTGNVIEFAIAVILAGAVGLVVNGFVNDIMMPIVGHFSGGVDFAAKFATLDGVDYKDLAAAEEAGVSIIKWGAWINTIINLIIVGFVLFMMSKAYNKTKKKAEEAAPAGPSDNDLLADILRIHTNLKRLFLIEQPFFMGFALVSLKLQEQKTLCNLLKKKNTEGRHLKSPKNNIISIFMLLIRRWSMCMVA